MRGELVAHRIRSDDGVEVALHRVAGGERRPAVLLVAGTFTNRRFWTGGRGAGFAHALLESGFDPWILEPRGHGASDRPRRWTLVDWVARDAPAAVARVREAVGDQPIYWVGHSAGGVVGAAFAGSRHAQVAELSGMVLVGAPGPSIRGLRRAGARLTHFASRWTPELLVPGRLLGLGPEHEPAVFVQRWMEWNLGGRWADAAGNDYLEGLHGLEIPILAVGGTGDSALAPPHAVRNLLDRFGPGPERTLLIAGTEHGYSTDYGHAGLLLGEPARREIWPRILRWLKRTYDRAGAAPIAPGAV